MWQAGKSGCVELLLKAGAKINQSNKKGSTPLYMACLNGQIFARLSQIERFHAFSPVNPRSLILSLAFSMPD